MILFMNFSPFPLPLLSTTCRIFIRFKRRLYRLGGFGLGFRGGGGRLRSAFATTDGPGFGGGAALAFSLASISLGSTSTGSLVIPEPGDDTGGAYHADFGTKTGFFGCDSKWGDMIWAPYSLNAS